MVARVPAELLLGAYVEAAMSGRPWSFGRLCERAWARGVIRCEPEAAADVVVCPDLDGAWRILVRRPLCGRRGVLTARADHLAIAFGLLAVRLDIGDDSEAIARALLAGLAGGSTRLAEAFSSRASLRARAAAHGGRRLPRSR